MVTNVRFYSFKDINLRRSVPFIVIVAMAFAMAIIAYDTPVAMLLLFFCYSLSGYVQAAIRLAQRKKPTIAA